MRLVGSLRGEMAWGFSEASSFVWFLGAFKSFLLVVGDIEWFQVVYCFSSYTNFRTHRRVISLMYSWAHVIDWGHSIFYSKSNCKKKISVVLSPSRLKKVIISYNFIFPILLIPMLYSLSDKNLLFQEIFLKNSHKTQNKRSIMNYFIRGVLAGSVWNFLKNKEIIGTRGGYGENWTEMGRSPCWMKRNGRPVK